MLERIKVLASLTSVKPMDMARRGQACPDSWKPPRVLPVGLWAVPQELDSPEDPRKSRLLRSGPSPPAPYRAASKDSTLHSAGRASVSCRSGNRHESRRGGCV